MSGLVVAVDNLSAALLHLIKIWVLLCFLVGQRALLQPPARTSLEILQELIPTARNGGLGDNVEAALIIIGRSIHVRDGGLLVHEGD